MALNLERLLFDPTDLASGPKVGSYIVGAGGEVATISDVGGLKALDVRIASGINVEVDLAFGDDSVTAHQGGSWTVDLSAGSLAALENITVSANNLDIRDLVFATDKVDVSGSVISVTLAAPNTTCLATVFTAGLAALQLPASSLANRKKITVQNQSDKSVFLGGSGVTISTGIEVGKGDSYTQDLGPSALLFVICGTAAKLVRVLEIS